MKLLLIAFIFSSIFVALLLKYSAVEVDPDEKVD